MPAQHKILTSPLRIALIVLVVGIILKIQHWPYGTITVNLAFTAILLMYPVRFIKKSIKNPIDWLKLGLVATWALSGLFSTNKLPCTDIIDYICFGFFISWVIIEIILFIKNDNFKRPTGVSNIFFYIAVAITFIGALFQLQHWPGATLMIVSGVIIAAILLLADFYIKK